MFKLIRISTYFSLDNEYREEVNLGVYTEAEMKLRVCEMFRKLKAIDFLSGYISIINDGDYYSIDRNERRNLEHTTFFAEEL